MKRHLRNLRRFAEIVFIFLAGCTTPEKAVVRTVIDIAKDVCTDKDTIDACVDRLFADRRVAGPRERNTGRCP